jgi:hypothetical protein
MIYLNENTLVQQTTTDYLKSNLDWKVCQVNNSVTFHGKPIRSEEFLNRMVEAFT